MPFRLYNTLTRREEEFVPLDPERVTLYVCGPTVYATPHVGNLRTFFFADLLHRYLEYRGHRVHFVMNLTDVDDKTITGARESGVSLEEFTAPFIEELHVQLEALGVGPADAYPRATRYIPQMVELVERLERKGLAYRAPDGSVYYDISAFPEYGRLSRFDLEAGRQGERVAGGDSEKADVRDFALWKAAKPEDDEVGAVWETPFGRGRPGWHLECSAMSMAELGETIDIHAGGVDLIFPHHEDEIAQSEGATGKPFVRYWVHGEFLQLDGEKMAKSSGKLFTLDDLQERGVRPSAVRYLFLTAHYRSRLNFTFEGLAAAAEAVRRIRGTRDRLRDHPEVVHPEPSDTPRLHESAAAALGAFARAMDDDLNTSVALAALHGLLPEINGRLDELGAGPITEAEKHAALDALERMDAVLQLIDLSASEEEADPALAAWVEERLGARGQARARKDFAESDAIRDELASRGIVVEDTPQGQRWKLG
jgi:cysteinyl-tRNA synthetase